MERIILDPVQPYSLVASARGSNPSRRTRDGIVEVVFTVGEGPAAARVWQHRDGSLAADIVTDDIDAATTHLRFLLATDVDPQPFLARAVDDPLLCNLVSSAPGLRPWRLSTVAHSAVQAVAGQLITAREARLIEQRIVEKVSAAHAGLWLPPTSDDLRSLSAAQLTQLGLAPRRAAALARIVRSFDLERLRTVPTAAAVARIERERTLGPWSAGVIALYGLGRYEHGLAGDLGLIRLCSALLGRPATTDDTLRLLEPYGEWAGLASVHLLRHPLTRQRYSRAA